LVDGMNKAAELYEQKEYFIPEILICSSAMYNGLDILMPLLVHHSVFKKGIGRLPKSSHYYTLPPNCFIFIKTGFCSNCITSRGSTVKQMY
jgi:hypothetical protein